MTTIAAIQKAVAKRWRVTIAELKGPRRHASLARARHVAFYLSRRLTKASYPEIAQAFDRSCHSTVVNGVKRIEYWLTQDDALVLAVRDLTDELVPRVTVRQYDPAKTTIEWRCRCGDPIMFADTEDNEEPTCFDCYVAEHGAPA